MAIIDELIAQMEASAEAARAANIERQQVIEAILNEIIARYGPEGAYGRAAEAMIEREKVAGVGVGAQRLIGAGLYGTEMAGGLERAWEAEVGAPARLRLEDITMERLTQAQLGMAGFKERIEDVYPDYGLMAQLISQAAAVPPTVPAPMPITGYGRAPRVHRFTGFEETPFQRTPVGETRFGTYGGW